MAKKYRHKKKATKEVLKKKTGVANEKITAESAGESSANLLLEKEAVLTDEIPGMYVQVEFFRSKTNDFYDCKFLKTNSSFAAFFQLDKKEIIGKYNAEIMCANSCGMFEPELINTLGNTSETSIEYYSHKYKQYFEISISRTNGKKAGLLIKNIAQTQKLKDSKKNYKLLVNNSPYSIIVFTAKRIVFINNSAINLLGGKSEDDFANYTIEHFFKNDDIEKITKNKLKQTTEIILKRLDKSVIDVEITAGNINYEDYSATQLLLKDITERKKTEKQLIKAKNKAEESARLKSMFLTNLSHEVRTPMNSILGFSDLLLRSKNLPSRAKDYSQQINAGSKQLMHIIDDLLNISQIQSNQIEFMPEKVNLDKLLKKLHLKYKLDTETEALKNVQIKLSIPDKTCDCVIKIDKQRLKQILTKLIENAVKYTENGSVEFGYIILKNNLFEFFVKDTGIGIEKSKQKLIFDPFRQEDDSETRSYEGMGLGLSIAKGLVEKFGGEIWLESKKNIGSVFYFTLPSIFIFPEKENLPEQAPKIYDWKNKTVLIVDDVPIIRQLFQDMLETTQINCIFANNGNEAVEICKNNKQIDIILMDIYLPDINGYQATTKIRESIKNMPVIVQTAYNSIEERKQIKNFGFDAFLVKPILEEELINAMAKFLQKNDK